MAIIHSARVTKHKRLKLMGEADHKLGRNTIMDRALAQKYGAAYVHTAAFAIDIDRVNEKSEESPELPFGWDVLLTDLYLCAFVAERPEALGLLDDVVLSVLDLSQADTTQTPLGSQLPFAVFTALSRGALPAELESSFRSWKKPPLDLAGDVAGWLKDRALIRRLCEHCLHTPISPPLVAPVREALISLRDA